MMHAISTLSDGQMFAILGQRLRQVREQAGLSPVQVHDNTGIADHLLSALEAGETPIHAGHIIRLSACYKLTPNQLFLGLAPSSSAAVSEADVEHLLRRFLQIDQPGRGDLFKGLVARIASAKPPSQ